MGRLIDVHQALAKMEKMTHFADWESEPGQERKPDLTSKSLKDVKDWPRRIDRYELIITLGTQSSRLAYIQAAVEWHNSNQQLHSQGAIRFGAKRQGSDSYRR